MSQRKVDKTKSLLNDELSAIQRMTTEQSEHLKLPTKDFLSTIQISRYSESETEQIHSEQNDDET